MTIVIQFCNGHTMWDRGVETLSRESTGSVKSHSTSQNGRVSYARCYGSESASSVSVNVLESLLSLALQGSSVIYFQSKRQ